jgi:hypothetical protein
MKSLVIVGIILIVAGVAGLAYGGFSFTTTEKVAEVGPLKLEKEKTRSVAIPPVLGAVAVAVGAAIVIVGARRS